MTIHNQNNSRRDFLKTSAAVGAVTALGANTLMGATPSNEPWFKISLAQWSLNRAFFKRSKLKLDNLEFAKVTRELGIDAIE